MLEKMFLIVFAITIWEYRKEISNSIFSCILIVLSYFSNLIYDAKTKMRINKARKKREAEGEEAGGSAVLMQKWEHEHGKKDKSASIKAMIKRWWPDDS
jgi:Ca2+/H+ antiporter